MKYLITISILMLSACGITLHSDAIKVDPITLTVKYTIDTSQITSFCTLECNNDSTCISKCYQDLMNTVVGAFNPTPSPTPGGN